MPRHPSPSRLEAFSDGVIAVIITIMVLELKIPQQDGFAGLRTIVPTLTVYLLSFTFTGVYWVNHHHLIDRLKHVDTLVLWTNLTFLFFLSLLPFFTNYMAEKHVNSFSVAVYAASLEVTGLSFTLLQKTTMRLLRHSEEPDPGEIAMQTAEVLKGKASLAMYLVAIGLACVRPWLGLATAALVTVMWILPSAGVRHMAQPHAHR